MLSWLAGKMIARNMKCDPGRGHRADRWRWTTTTSGSPFPATAPSRRARATSGSWRPWLDRFVSLGLQIYPDEVVLKGFPWRQTICVRGHIHLDDPEDGRVYDNRYVIWGRIVWGKMREYEVYEDTEKTRRLDEWLASG